MKDRVAIITGAGSGFGRATATRMVELGVRVVVADINEVGGNETLALVESLGGEGLLVVGDIATAEGATALVARTVEQFGRIDVLVNNAGIPQDGPSWDCTEETWDRLLRVNLKSVFLCSKAALPHLIERRGSIVNVASLSASISIGGAAYAAAKGGILAYSRHVAAELAPLGVRVNCVSPGFMRTPMSTRSNRGATVEEQEAWVSSRTRNIPLGRIGAPEDIAAVICYLASDEAGFITGQELLVDGGAIVRGPTP